MRYINLTPHPIEVFTEMAFQGLEQLNPSTWVADICYTEQAVAVFPSEGSARISVTTEDLGLGYGDIPMVATVYGDAIGIPDCDDDDILIVSLPMQSMMKASGHPLANQAVSPYKVVRNKIEANGKVSSGSTCYGCMGFTK